MKYIRSRDRIYENTIIKKANTDLLVNQVSGKIQFPQIELSIAIDSINDIIGRELISVHCYYYSNALNKFQFEINDIDDIYNLTYAMICNPVHISVSEYEDMKDSLISVVNMLSGNNPDYEIRFDLFRTNTSQLAFNIYMITNYYVSPKDEMYRLSKIVSDSLDLEQSNFKGLFAKYKYLGSKDFEMYIEHIKDPNITLANNATDLKHRVGKYASDNDCDINYLNFNKMVSVDYVIIYSPPLSYRLNSNYI